MLKTVGRPYGQRTSAANLASPSPSHIEQAVSRSRLQPSESTHSSNVPMPARFFDCQDTNNPQNGTIIVDGGAIEALIDAMRAREPFLAELVGDAGHKLLLGLGSADGCVQFSSVDGQPPYLMALRDSPVPEGAQDFLIGNTPTSISRRFCLPMGQVARIATAFLRTGQRPPDVEWEAI